MWVRINDREMINVDAKVVRIIKEDLPLQQGNTGYYIGFYESLDVKAQSTQQLKFDIPSDRDEAFEIINTQLETIDITKIDR